jgi:cobyrinic acid a,c-diamide synthase
MKIPRLVIAGTHSGCGKTTISMGIMAALVAQGLKVQPYKIGPDYIDPMFHTFITGRASRNLDSWMLPPETLKTLLAESSAGADIAIIEGVMGLYDGYGGTTLSGSTADVSQITGSPVILVIDGAAMALSAAALVKGFADFNPNTMIKGVIINNISSEGHYRLLKEIIEEHTGVMVLGYLRKLNEFSIASRHLGLITSAEIGDLQEKIALLTREIQATVDLELLMKLSRDVTGMDIKSGAFEIERVGRVKIAVAKDKAFCFYYQDNLELFQALGAELEFFSPLSDSGLPPNIDGLYIGGGYPEVWAEMLQDNHALRTDVKNRIQNGLPTYAECGGLMYLGGSIINSDNQEFEMAGVIPGKSRMESGLKRFGYVFVKVTDDNILAPKGFEIRAHEYHYSEMTVDDDASARGIKTCFEVSKRKAGMITKSWNCGFKTANLLAGYPHLHFWANPKFAGGFINSCRNNSAKQPGGHS